MDSKKLFRAVVILLTLVLVFSAAVPALTASTMVKVIVTFDHQPQAADLERDGHHKFPVGVWLVVHLNSHSYVQR